MIALIAVFVASSGAVTGTLTGSPSGFESGDGNMTLQTTDGTATDWNCFTNQAGFASNGAQPSAGQCNVTSGATQQWADGGSTAVGTSEFQFKSGSKFDDACTVINTGNNPPKDEWTNIAEYTEASTAVNLQNGHDLFFYGASIRPVVNGNVSANVYFSQATTGCHTVGDVLLAFDFVNGGGTPALHSLTWISSGTCYVSSDSAPCWGNLQQINGAFYNGSENPAVINAADNGINNTLLPVNAFAEFGINLTQAVHAGNPTGALPCFANQTWVSRSSGSSFSSNPEDVEVVNRATCGEIKIIKQTSPRGLDQQFSFTSTLNPNTAAGGVTCTGNSSAGVQSDGSFCLNDAGNTGKTLGSTLPADNSAGNTVDETQLQAGTYTVTESAPGTGFAYASITCTPAGSATVNDTTRTATITLGIGGSVTCVVQNNQQLGAIKILKTSSKAAHTLLNGAHFQICSNAGPYTTANPCTPVQTGSGDLQTSGTDTSAGTVCIDHLPFGNGYYVSEKTPPSGYADDSNGATTQVTVSVNTTCSGSPQTFTYRDTPLTDLTVHVASEVSGGTKSAIFCHNSSSTSIGNSPQPTGAISGTTSTYGDPETVTANGLTPGTYVCTVVIDP